MKFATTDKLICYFPKKLDTDFFYENQEELTKEIDNSPKEVIFDFEQVNYISSAILSFCLRIMNQKGKGNFKIIHIRPEILRVFEIAGLHEQLLFS